MRLSFSSDFPLGAKYRAATDRVSSEAARSATIMLAHQIKSDCDRCRPAVDASEGRHEAKSMSPDGRNTIPQEDDQHPGCSSPSTSHDSSGTQPYERIRTSSGRAESGLTRHQVAHSEHSNGSRLTGKPMRSVQARLLVRRREAGALIGKRGANIKRLRQIFHESAFNIPDTGNGPERVVCISTCSLDQLAVILAELTQLFHEKQQNPSARGLLPTLLPAQSASRAGESIELKLLVNASHAGLLIGVGGQSIRKLRSDSKAAIKIYEMCCPLSSERVCAIKAKPPVVVSTVKMILEILATNPIKGTHKPYDAQNFDLFLVDKYGGFAADDEPSSLSSSPPTAPAASPLDFLHQLHQASPQTLPPQSALILQNQAAQLLAAAAAATAVASGGARGQSSAEYLDFERLRSAPSHLARMLGRVPASRDRYAAAAAMAAEKYHSIMKSGQLAAIANRFHPYQTYGQPRGCNQPPADGRQQANHDQDNHSFRRSGAHGPACSCCEANADVQTTSSSPAGAGNNSGPDKEPLV